MYNCTVTSLPSGYPVTLEEVKALLRITSTAEDDLLDSLIAVATETLEAYTRRVFIERTVQEEFDSVMISGTEVYPFVKLCRSPLISVTTVEIYDGTSFVEESYQTKDQPGFARILFNEWTYGTGDTPFPLRVTFKAGYGDAVAVPSTIKQAIMMYANYLYVNRGDCNPECRMGVPVGVRALLGAYKIVDVFGV
ncbi:MAG: hypothetical protein GY820_17225 [Gammaproteobacteria bacterium]|nr:hypothetical protein [Gammaproteobacteria bacterium]